MGHRLEVVQAIPSVKYWYQPKWCICNHHFGGWARARSEDVDVRHDNITDQAVRHRTVHIFNALLQQFVQLFEPLCLNHPQHFQPIETRIGVRSIREKPNEQARSRQCPHTLPNLEHQVRKHVVQHDLVVHPDQLFWVLIAVHSILRARLNLPALLLPPHVFRLEAGDAMVICAPAPLQ